MHVICNIANQLSPQNHLLPCTLKGCDVIIGRPQSLLNVFIAFLNVVVQDLEDRMRYPKKLYAPAKKGNEKQKILCYNPILLSRDQTKKKKKICICI